MLRLDTIGGLKLELLQDWLKNDAITAHADVSKAQNSAINASKWCDLGINRTIFSQSDFRQLLNEVEHGIENYQRRGLRYPPKRKAEQYKWNT